MRYAIEDIKPGFTFWLKGEKLIVRKVGKFCENSCCMPEMAHVATLDGFGRGQFLLQELVDVANKYQLTFQDLYERFPKELKEKLASCEQDPVYHPEGVLQNHIHQVFEYALKFENEQLLLCALFHDLGKPETQQFKIRNNGTIKISNIGHEMRAQYYIDKYLDLFEDLKPNKELISEVCRWHMYAHLYVNGTLKKKGKRETFEKMKYFKELVQFAECDNKGRVKL